MAIIDTANNQTGSNADTSYVSVNGTVLVPVGGNLPVGYPVTRNIGVPEGNYLSQFSAVTGFAAFANGDELVRLELGGPQLAAGGGPSTLGASAFTGGVYTGQPIQNPWTTVPLGVINPQPLFVEAIFARTGVRPVFVGVVNGGTAIKIGDFVTKGPTLGTTSLYPYLTSSGGTTAVNLQTFGQVIATPIWTTLSAPIGPGTALVAGVWNTNGIVTTPAASALTINPGGANQETVVVSAVTATAPAVAALTVALVAGSAATVQLTFNVAGYSGSAGLIGPTGTNTTLFTLSIPIPSGSTAAQSATLIYNALIASGFTFGTPQNVLGIGSGNFQQIGATAGTPASGALIYVSQAAGVLTFSAAMPGTWANTNLTYTVTVLGGTTQTFNTAVAGSATAVPFTGGVNGTFTATLANAHVQGENVIGLASVVTSAAQTIIVPIPATAGMQNTGIVYVDMATA